MKTVIQRIAFLSSELAGYTAACQRRLKEKYGVELLVVHWPVASNAPFREQIFAHIDHRYDKSTLTGTQLIQLLEDFAPQAMLISGWMDKDYLRAARHMRKASVPVLSGCDTQWTGRLRQRVGSWIAPWYLHRSIDVLWVTGERQRQLAWRLGYRGERCWSGYYACDWESFAIQSPRQLAAATPAFLYVGRLIQRKGIDTLIAAYQQYRQAVEEPWALWVAGTGEGAQVLEGVEGVKALGFVQPEALPALFQQVSAFVLPSRVEPWGVVVQEAAAAGLPLICSDVSGAAVHLLTDHYNGYWFETSNATQLANCMQRMTALSHDGWAQMSQHSFELSKQFTPELWADTLIQGLEKFPKANCKPQSANGEQADFR